DLPTSLQNGKRIAKPRDGDDCGAVDGRSSARLQVVSLRERMHELGLEARGELPIVDAIVVRKLAGRHMERAKNEIEYRERRGKVLLAAAACGGVMPAVEDRTGNDV